MKQTRLAVVIKGGLAVFIKTRLAVVIKGGLAVFIKTRLAVCYKRRTRSIKRGLTVVIKRESASGSGATIVWWSSNLHGCFPRQ
jgi:shikimate kinase